MSVIAVRQPGPAVILNSLLLARCCTPADDDVPFRGALDAQVRIGRAKPQVLGLIHGAFPLDEQGPFKSLDNHSHDYCSANDTAAVLAASSVAISGNFSTNASRSESTNGATTIGNTSDAKGRASSA
jgi:hypothetical protein